MSKSYIVKGLWPLPSKTELKAGLNQSFQEEETKGSEE